MTIRRTVFSDGARRSVVRSSQPMGRADPPSDGSHDGWGGILEIREIPSDLERSYSTETMPPLHKDGGYNGGGNIHGGGVIAEEKGTRAFSTGMVTEKTTTGPLWIVNVANHCNRTAIVHNDDRTERDDMAMVRMCRILVCHVDHKGAGRRPSRTCGAHPLVGGGQLRSVFRDCRNRSVL